MLPLEPYGSGSQHLSITDVTSFILNFCQHGKMFREDAGVHLPSFSMAVALQ
ncbi:hypothetical protein LEMLEM_LOCUS9897 [Lemmus lemmus]